MKYNKVLELSDYNDIADEVRHIENIHNLLSGATHRFEHEHRKWEYGLAMKVIRDENVQAILDVGGGGSAFAPAMAWLDRKVIQVDPGDVGGWIDKQSQVINKELEFHQLFLDDFSSSEKFDCVVCLSTIEHVGDDVKFIKRLSTYVKENGFLILTTDFHPSGQAQSSGHIKTYNSKSLKELVKPLLKLGFGYYGNVPTYDNFEPNVYNYSFASVVLVRGK